MGISVEHSCSGGDHDSHTDCHDHCDPDSHAHANANPDTGAHRDRSRNNCARTGSAAHSRRCRTGGTGSRAAAGHLEDYRGSGTERCTSRSATRAAVARRSDLHRHPRAVRALS